MYMYIHDVNNNPNMYFEVTHLEKLPYVLISFMKGKDMLYMYILFTHWELSTVVEMNSVIIGSLHGQHNGEFCVLGIYQWTGALRTSWSINIYHCVSLLNGERGPFPPPPPFTKPKLNYYAMGMA